MAGDLPELVLAACAEDDLGALISDEFRGGFADTRRGASDDDNFVLDHDNSLSCV